MAYYRGRKVTAREQRRLLKRDREKEARRIRVDLLAKIGNDGSLITALRRQLAAQSMRPKRRAVIFRCCAQLDEAMR